jgi:hypothetical protein
VFILAVLTSYAVLILVEKMLPLTGSERKKYLAELEKSKNLDGYMSSDPAGLKLRKLKRKEPAAKSGAETCEVEIKDLDGTGDEVAFVLADSPQPKKMKTGKAVDSERDRSASRDVGGTSLNVEATKSFWHSEFDFRKYVLVSSDLLSG